MVQSARTDDAARPERPTRRPRDVLSAAQALRPTLIAIARRITNCPYQAEDVVQDVFVRLLPDARPVHAEVCDAYVCRMVRNLAIDRVRRRRFEDRLCTGLDAADTCPAADTISAERELISAEALAAVNATLADLPARDRAIFTQHRLEGIPQKQIAERHCLSPAAVCTIVKKVHCRCLEVLREVDCVRDTCRTIAAAANRGDSAVPTSATAPRHVGDVPYANRVMP